MTNFKLTIAYDGSHYHGWQRQPLEKGVSIQWLIEQKLQIVLGEQAQIHGAGRTDAGVHAAGQVAHLRTARPIPAAKLQLALNHQLPPDIRILAVAEAAADFHAQYSARRKRYRYTVAQGGAESPFSYRYCWRQEKPLDLAAMREAAGYLLGRHDFRHFTLAACRAKSFEREIFALDILTPPPSEAGFPWQQITAPLLIEVEADGFLYKMVRLIAARLVACGQGRIPPAALAGYLRGDSAPQLPPAPAQGLMLLWVDYPAEKVGEKSGEFA